MARRLAKGGARPAGTSTRIAARVRAKLALHRFPQTGVLPLGASLLCVGLVTAGLLLLDQTRALSLAPISYLIPVIIAATQWGIWPATLASIASMAAADFFFFPPIFSFVVEDPQEVVDLMLFLVVALVSS